MSSHRHRKSTFSLEITRTWQNKKWTILYFKVPIQDLARFVNLGARTSLYSLVIPPYSAVWGHGDGNNDDGDASDDSHTSTTPAAPIKWPFTLGQVLSWHFLHFFETAIL